MKKYSGTILSLLVTLTLTVTGCSSGSSTKTTASATPAGTAAPATGGDQKPAAGGGEKVIIKVGYVNADKSPVDMAVVKLAEIVKQKTNGKVEVQRFANGQLGGEKDMLESMKIGAVDSVITGDAAIPIYIPKYAGLSTPYAVKSIDHELKILNGPIGQEMGAALNTALNSTVVDWWVRGARNLTAKREIKTPADLKGMKLRVPEIPLSVESWKALGANPTPLAFPELYVGLQQGVVDGQENPIDLIYTSKFYEVQSHVMLTEHLFAPFVFLVNNKKLASIPEEQRKVFLDAVKEAGKYEVQVTKDSEADYKKKLTEAGAKVIEVDKEAWAKKLDETQPYKKFEKDWVPDLLKRIKDAQ